MHESRCGVRCTVCGRKNKVNCAGCLNIVKPFWGGECKVKTCCENQKLPHCGVCPDFPCVMISEMGKDAGFDPLPRLNMLKKWAQQ